VHYSDAGRLSSGRQDPLYTLGLIHTVLDETREQLCDDIVVLSLS
jgi:hypothetical protein